MSRKRDVLAVLRMGQCVLQVQDFTMRHAACVAPDKYHTLDIGILGKAARGADRLEHGHSRRKRKGAGRFAQTFSLSGGFADAGCVASHSRSALGQATAITSGAYSEVLHLCASHCALLRR